MTNTPLSRKSLLPPLIAGIAVLLFGSASVAHMLEWGPGVPRGADAAIVPAASAPARADVVPAVSEPSDERPARIRPRCAECGVIESMRQVDTGSTATTLKSARPYELTLRLNDGSRQVISSAHAGGWKVGERVIAIAAR